MKQFFWTILLIVISMTALQADEFYTPQTLGGTTTFGGRVVAESNIVIYDGHLAVAFVEVVDDHENISLWVDDGGTTGIADDGIINGDEIRKSFIKKHTLVYGNGYPEPHHNWGGDLAMRVVNGKVSMVFRSYSGKSAEIYSWHDYDNNLVVGWDEWFEHNEDYVENSRSLDAAYSTRFAMTSVSDVNDRLVLGHDNSGTENGAANKINVGRINVAYNTMVSHGGVINLFYQDTVTGNLKLWRDTNGNFRDNSNEISIVIDGSSAVCINARANIVGGKLAVSYYDKANYDLKWWVDKNNNTTVDANEIGSISELGAIECGEYSDILMFNGHTTVVYTKNDGNGMKLCVWSDDGAASGTADDNIAQAGEIRIMIYAGSNDYGRTCRAVEHNGLLYIAFTDSDNSECLLTAYDLGDAPVMADQSFDIDENKPNGSPVGTLIATAAHGRFTEVASDGAAYFAVHPDTGAIIVQDNSILDFETGPNVYTYTVKLEDTVSHKFVTADIMINIQDVNEVPPVIADVTDQSFDLAESDSDGTVVGILIFVGDDAVITGGTGDGYFTLDPLTGEITVTDNGSVDYGEPTATLFIEVTESSTQTTSTATVTIDLTANTVTEPEEPTGRNVSASAAVRRKHHDQFTMHKINPCLFSPAQGTQVMLIFAYALLALVMFGLVRRGRTV